MHVTFRSACAGALAALTAHGVAAAIDCEHAESAGVTYTVCRADAARDDLHVFLSDASGQPLRTFAALDALLAAQDKRLLFATNGGMFHADRRPVGLLIEQQNEIAPLNLDEGIGNFFLKPNGVFFIGAEGAGIAESSTVADSLGDLELATQSGPLLVADGELHPGLDPQSSSRFIRNGVGVDGERAVVFAISHEPVTFHELAVFFRDALDCPDALYLDGAVSSIYAPALGERIERADRGLGPIIAIVETPSADP
jgi:uncharacterized protein YigE (DUF2233 family)